MKPLEFEVADSQSILAFTNRPDGPGSRPWWRELDLAGKPLYRIGNICDTCEALFEKLQDANLPLAPAELSQRFREGLGEISQEINDTIAHILPKGNYIAALLWIHPEKVQIDISSDCLSHQYFWKARHPAKFPEEVLPPTQRKKLWQLKIPRPVNPSGLREDLLHETVLPLIEESQLNQASIDTYKGALKKGSSPTALALSVVDLRYPSGRSLDCRLVHFLLDGHHKMMAASQLNKPITLLSFLNITESFASTDWIDTAVKLRYKE